MSDHAANIRRLRKTAKWTQAELAERAEVPRATLANMERDGSNPGIDSIVSVAKALNVAVDELVTPPPEQRFYKVAVEDQQEYRAEGGRFLARLVSPIASTGVQVHLVTIMPNTRSIGRPHPQGAQEFYLTLSGCGRLEIDGEVVEVENGTLVQFPGHKRHIYINADPIQVTTALSVVVFQPR